jgi:hypothetical protein
VGPLTVVARGREADRVELLTASRGPLDGREPPRMVLDTDTFNEIDDQFALVHALLSPDRARCEAIYAAPFHNEKSDGPGDGMRKSYEEIQRILELLDLGDSPPVLEGATEWMSNRPSVERTTATDDLISRALSGPTDPLYVVAIGAPTNVSNAVLLAPEIIGHIVVVWLGGNSLYWPTAQEFNLKQDPWASRVLFASGVALVHVPCLNVTDHLLTTRDEIEHYVRPQGKAGEFLAARYAEFVDDNVGTSKVIWDLGAVAWLLDESWATTAITQSPILTDELTWSRDPTRHMMGEVTSVRRDAIFADLFRRLGNHAGGRPRA